MGYLNDLQYFSKQQEEIEKQERIKKSQKEAFERQKKRRLNQRDRQKNLRGLPDKDSEIDRLRKINIRSKLRIKMLQKEIEDLKKQITNKEDIEVEIEIKDDIETIEIWVCTFHFQLYLVVLRARNHGNPVEHASGPMPKM